MVWAFASVAAVALFWLGFRHPRRRRWLLPRPIAPRLPAGVIDRQHQHLLAGGRLSETAVAATAARFQDLLRSGRTADLERQLRPGMEFALQVKALTIVGTVEAGRVLERQLERRMSRDLVEQTWYWADVASGLRQLRYGSALPALLRFADASAVQPGGTVLAAEVVAFPNFPSALDAGNPQALRALVRVSRGCRDGIIDPTSMLAVGLGNLLAAVSESAPARPDPWLTSAILEAERVSRRIAMWGRAASRDIRPAAEKQRGRLEQTAEARRHWLRTAPKRLIERFPAADSAEKEAILSCLVDFRVSVLNLFPHFPDRREPWWSEAVRGLTWSPSSVAGPVLAKKAGDLLGARRRHSQAAIVLASLRGHPCVEAERVLLWAAGTSSHTLRQAAAAALGWWPPFNPGVVLAVLQTLRTDSSRHDTRLASLAALARLGVRSALDEIRSELASDEASVRSAAAARIAREELSWLWPDLQELADSADPQTALPAAEALERLREAMLGLVG